MRTSRTDQSNAGSRCDQSMAAVQSCDGEIMTRSAAAPSVTDSALGYSRWFRDCAQAAGAGVPLSSRPGGAARVSLPLLQYSLPPDKLAKAYALYRHRRFALYFVTDAVDFLVLLLMLRTRFGARLRDWAEQVSRCRFVQAASRDVRVRAGDASGAASVRSLWAPHPPAVRAVGAALGVVVRRLGQGPGCSACIFVSLLGWILYGVLRRSPRRWWFYFWLALIPIVVFVLFIAPVWIEPLFNKYEPLSASSPRPGGADRTRGASRGHGHPARAHVRDEGQREDHRAERLRHRLRRHQARRGVGHDDGAHDDAGDAVRLRPRDGALRSRTYPERDCASTSECCWCCSTWATGWRIGWWLATASAGGFGAHRLGLAAVAGADSFRADVRGYTGIKRGVAVLRASGRSVWDGSDARTCSGSGPQRGAMRFRCWARFRWTIRTSGSLRSSGCGTTHRFAIA